MRNYGEELNSRVAFIQSILTESHAKGIIFGNSGGKDCALVGILCKKACENVLGVIMPCQSTRNFGIDKEDGLAVAKQYGIESVLVDLSETKKVLQSEIEKIQPLEGLASGNIAPRLRMNTLYALGAERGYLVAGTGNRSERYLGYFTKWGDGACDFNPIGDLTVTEVYEFLRYLGAPNCVLTKAPSAGLYEGQTDELEIGLTYAEIDEYLLKGTATSEVMQKLKKFHIRSEHKRVNPPIYGE